VSQALDRSQAEGFDLDHLLGEPEGLHRQEDASRRGQLFHAGSEMRRLPDSRVIHMQIVADRTDHDFTRIEPHPNLDLDLVGLADLVSVRPEGFLHRQGRVAGPYRVILMRNGGTEQCHDAIAHNLIDSPFVAMHGRHHPFQHRIEELPCFLRIAIGQEFHGAFEVGKEHGDVLAFAFQGTAGRQNFLSKIGGRVGQRLTLWGRH
jgi:hypothetical protein